MTHRRSSSVRRRLLLAAALAAGVVPARVSRAEDVSAPAILQWFEGTYVFDTAKARDEFQAEFESAAGNSPGSEIIGSAPVTIEPYEVVAIAEGPQHFRRGPGPGSVGAA